jgi:hypothetical protein
VPGQGIPAGIVVIPNAGTGPHGAFDLELFDAAHEHGVSVPDNATTMMLLGTPLNGLSLLRRFMRR